MTYRFLRAVRIKGNIALQDGRHGHPSKLRGEARAFLEASCREAPCTSSPTLQAALRDRALNRDLEMLCAKVAQEQPRLSDGRRLLFREFAFSSNRRSWTETNPDTVLWSRRL
jgi:hypothetical protein